jgi:taurine dioxygenase
MEARPLTATFGAEIVGVDASRPLADASRRSLLDAFHEHAVLLLRGQTLTKRQFVDFSRNFGELVVHVLSQYNASDTPEVMRLSNRDEAGNPVVFHNGAEAWHSDLSFMKVTSLGTILYGVAVPPSGGDTLFADGCAAYDALDGAMKARIHGLRAVHSFSRYQSRRFADRPLTAEQRAQTPDVSHPVVRTHPVTGRKSLYLGDDVIARVEGMEEREGKGLMDDLLRHATQDRFVYRHRWRPGDIVLYDNRCTLHRVTDYDSAAYERTLWRTSLKGDIPM